MPSFHFLVGTFNTPDLYTLALDIPALSSSSSTSTSSPSSPSDSTKSTLRIVHRADAVGSHSWLHLSPWPALASSSSSSTTPSSESSKHVLYATAWTEPPSLVAYAVHSPSDMQLINSVRTASRSGYVTASSRAVYSAGGASGEVFAIDPDTGGFAVSSSAASSTKDTASDSASNHDSRCSTEYAPLQKLSFVEEQPQKDDGSVLDFGGLRHGAHSADLSPDGSALFVADIGRNAIFAFAVNQDDGTLALHEKHISPRSHDGPRHTWPHPNGKILYVLQEHSSMVDVFSIVGTQDEQAASQMRLKHVQAVSIIPSSTHYSLFWADEVRTSLSNGAEPKYLYTSTRGLKNETKGYVAVFKLQPDGLVDMNNTESVNGNVASSQDGLLAMYETPTSGGWANAVQPGPTVDGVEYLALTDSEEGYVMVLAWDGKELREAARVNLSQGRGKEIVGAATAVWL